MIRRVEKVGNPPGRHPADIIVPENQITAQIVMSHVRDREVLTRTQAIVNHVSRHVVPEFAEDSWVTDVEVHEGTPEMDYATQFLAEHIAAGNILQEKLDRHLALYSQATTDLLGALKARYGVAS